MKTIWALALLGAVAATSACSQTTTAAAPATTTQPAMTAPVAPMMAAPAPVKVKTKATGSATVRAAQADLKKAGFEPGPIDGVAGKKTAAATKAFQKSKGLKETGRLDKATLGALKG